MILMILVITPKIKIKSKKDLKEKKKLDVNVLFIKNNKIYMKF